MPTFSYISRIPHLHIHPEQQWCRLGTISIAELIRSSNVLGVHLYQDRIVSNIGYSHQTLLWAMYCGKQPILRLYRLQKAAITLHYFYEQFALQHVWTNFLSDLGIASCDIWRYLIVILYQISIITLIDTVHSYRNTLQLQHLPFIIPTPFSL